MKWSVLGLCLLSFISPPASAKTVNVAHRGIVPGQDVTLLFPKGQYEFYPENAVEVYRAVTNHDNGLKRMAFRLFGVKGFTLDGGGSTFVFHGRICPIVLDEAKGATLKNFSIDWDTPFHHELKVVERNEKDRSFVAEISPMTYGFDWPIRMERLSQTKSVMSKNNRGLSDETR